MNKTTLAAAITTATLMMGVSGQASAVVYAGSRLDIDNLNIYFADANQAPTVQQPVSSYQFTLTNTAALDGGDFKTVNCTGTVPGLPGTTNNCSATPKDFGSGSRDPNPANAPTVAAPGPRANNDMTFFGPTADYANSDSVVNTAAVLLQGTTDTDQVAEAALSTKLSASSQAEIQSRSGFSMTFTIAGTNNLVVDFFADPDLRSYMLGEFAGSGAQSNLNVNFTLSQDTDAAGGTLQKFEWAPGGSVNAGDCSIVNGIAGITCTENFDTQNLNTGTSVSTNGADDTESFPVGGAGADSGFGDVLTRFGIFITGLDSGTWTLRLNSVTSTSLTRVVPEPGMLALLGIGLLGMGAAARRRTRA